MKYKMISLLIIVIFVFPLIGCSKTSSEISDKYVQNDEIVQDKQDNIKKISSNSEVNIINTLEDGTFWTLVIDEIGQTKVVYTNIYGDVLGSMDKKYGFVMERGLDKNRFIMRENDDYKIYDINTYQEVSDIYKGDYDKIINYIQTEDDTVFGIVKTIDTFEEKYCNLKLVNKQGKTFFDICLDSKSLLDNYNIEKYYNSADDLSIRYAGNNIFCILNIGLKYDSNKLNALVIDLNRDKIIPTNFPSGYVSYIYSDGDYTIVHSEQSDIMVVDHEMGTAQDYPNQNYIPESKISDGVFYATGRYNGNAAERVFLNMKGDIVIDLNQYSQKVLNAYPFQNGAACVEFANNYVAFIDLEGNLLFDPIKGYSPKYLDNMGIVIMYDASYDNSERKIFSVDKNGNIKEINLTCDVDDCMLIEYEGGRYWISDGISGLQIQEY